MANTDNGKAASDTNHRLLRVREVADWLECSPRTVYRLIESGELEHVPVTGDLMRVSETAVEKFIKGKARR